MKNKVLAATVKKGRWVRPWVRSTAMILGLAGSGAFLVAPSQASANTELDHRYALETVGVLRATDNMDGLFGDYVLAAFRDYFSRQSRFVLQDLTRSDEILTHSSVPLAKLLQDNSVLSQLARTTRAQTLVRTTVRKEGPQYRFTIEWLHAPGMDALAAEEFVLQEKGGDQGGTQGFSMAELKASLQQALDGMIKKIPFIGMITGRDNNSVTVNMGSVSGVKPGDTLVVATLDDVKRHPLLKQVVDWRLTPMGRVQVDQVDEKIAFGHVIEEEEGKKIARYQKITQVIPKPVQSAAAVTTDADDTRGYPGPTLGWVGLQLWPGGGFTRQFSASSATTGRIGGGFLLGAAAEGNLWLTREWFVDAHFGYGFWAHDQRNIQTGLATAVSSAGSMSHFRLGAGYSFLVNNDFFGPKAWVKFGYQTTGIALPINVSELLDSMSFSSLLVGVGGQLPIRNEFGAVMNFEYGLFPGATETGGVAGSVSSASTVIFYLGGYYQWTPRMTIRAGFEVLATGAEFSSGYSLSQKSITFAPALLYYF